MSNHIEIGKKYIIVNSKAGNNGEIVVVTGYAGKPGLGGYDLHGIRGDRYYIDKWLVTNRGDKVNHVGELQLKRIDDYEGDEKTTWESMKDIWTPDTVGA